MIGGGLYNQPQPKQVRALFVAIRFGDVSTVADALDAGAPMECRNRASSTPLMQAVMSQRAEIVEYLLRRGADVNATSGFGFTPLHIAAEYPSTTISTILIVNGAKVEALDSRGMSPLWRACEAGQLEQVRLLIQKGADVCREAGGLSLLHVAARGPNWPLAMLLIEGGFDIHRAEGDSGYTPLMDAAYGKHSELVAFLLANGADPGVRCSRGRTALDYAVEPLADWDRGDDYEEQYRRTLGLLTRQDGAHRS